MILHSAYHGEGELPRSNLRNTPCLLLFHFRIKKNYSDFSVLSGLALTGKADRGNIPRRPKDFQPYGIAARGRIEADPRR
jgi:hypothetical protein